MLCAVAMLAAWAAGAPTGLIFVVGDLLVLFVVPACLREDRDL